MAFGGEESDRIGNNEVSKCKLKKYLFGEKKEKPANFVAPGGGLLLKVL